MSKTRRSLSLPIDLQRDIEEIATEKDISRQAVIEKAVELYTGCIKLEKRQKGKLTGFEITPAGDNTTADVLPFTWRL